MDNLDLYLLHRPCPLMNPAEVAEALEQLKREGKVNNFGLSNFLPEQIAALEAYTDIPLVTNQIKMSVKCMPANSRVVMTTPLEQGSMPQMHSKQPQEVIGSSSRE